MAAGEQCSARVRACGPVGAGFYQMWTVHSATPGMALESWPRQKIKDGCGTREAHQYQCFFGTPCLMRTCQSRAMSAAPDSSTRRHHRSDLMLLLSQLVDDRSRVGLRTFLQCLIPPLSCTVQMLGRGCRLILGAPSELTGPTSTDAPCPLSWIRGWATRT